MLLQIFQNLLCFDIILCLHCPDYGKLHGRYVLLHQMIDVDHFPGIFPDPKARHLRDQWACCINAATGQYLHAPVLWQEAVFDAKRIDAQRDYLGLVWWQVFEDGGLRVETRNRIRI